MSASNGDQTLIGLQWTATAFYLVAIAHSLALHRESDASTRRWAAIYLTTMIPAFLVGWRRDGNPLKATLVTLLLVGEYLAIRGVATTLDRPRGDSRHLVGAVVEAVALALAYALVYGFEPSVREGDKTQ